MSDVILLPFTLTLLALAAYLSARLSALPAVLALLPFHKKPEEVERRVKRARPWMTMLFFLLYAGMEFRYGMIGDLFLSTPSAKAETIASHIFMDLRSLRDGALTRIREISDDLRAPESENQLTYLLPYLDGGDSKWPEKGWAYRVAPDMRWVGCRLSDYPFASYALKRESLDMLERRARRSRLYGASSLEEPPLSTDVAYLYKAGDETVWMPVSLSDEEERKD